MLSSYLSSENQTTLPSRILFLRRDLSSILPGIRGSYGRHSLLMNMLQNLFKLLAEIFPKTRLLAKDHPHLLEISCHIALSIGHVAQHRSLLLPNQQREREQV